VKVRAKHWLKYDGVWYMGGAKFEVSTAEADRLKRDVEIAETPVLTAEPEKPAEAPAEEPVTEVAEPQKRRGRPKKTAE